MKEYRQDAHTAPLVVWAVLCLLTAVFLFAHASRLVDRLLRTEEVLLAVGLLIVGPIGLAAYLYRARHVWVSVVPDGLLVSGRHLVPWSEISRVERRPARFRPERKGLELPDLSWAGDGCFALGGEWGGLAAALGLLLAALAVVWLVAFVAVPLLVVPLLEIYAPFGDRVRIHRRRGRPITLRDLRDADDLMARLERRAP
ncbi:MAG TPA: hypothetical protein VEJ18_21790 [Planctomycetota bacterium]|nr:hypothetical protein [Planctomycetota bacterium]